MTHPPRAHSPAATGRDVSDLNTILRWLAHRDLPDLTPEGLAAHAGAPAVDLLVLLGSAVLATVDAAALAWRRGLAPAILVAGGVGHSTGLLRAAVRADARYADVPVEGRTESEIFADLLADHHGVPRALLRVETTSTNCGSNAVETRRLLDESGERPSTVLLLQDPTMQLRSCASFRRVWETDPSVRFYGFAAFVPSFVVRAGGLEIEEGRGRGVWEPARLVELAMGEIPRLRDDEQGYGPRGRGFIAHVEVPASVEAAYRRLRPRFAPRRADGGA